MARRGDGGVNMEGRGERDSGPGVRKRIYIDVGN